MYIQEQIFVKDPPAYTVSMGVVPGEKQLQIVPILLVQNESSPPR